MAEDGIAQRLPSPSKKDREIAANILEYLQGLRDLGAFSGESTRQAEINYIALSLRNARLGY